MKSSLGSVMQVPHQRIKLFLPYPFQDFLFFFSTRLLSLLLNIFRLENIRNHESLQYLCRSSSERSEMALKHYLHHSKYFYLWTSVLNFDRPKATVAIGLFTDLFLYGLIVPILPFMLRDRIDLPQDKVQAYTSGLLAAYAGASVLFSIPAGWIADKTGARQTPFLTGLAALLGATILLGVGQSIAVLVVARVLQGISAAVVWTVGLAMVLDTVGSENLGKVIGSVW